jgi:hypothetical protein
MCLPNFDKQLNTRAADVMSVLSRQTEKEAVEGGQDGDAKV